MKLGNSFINDEIEIGDKVFPIRISIAKIGDAVAKEQDTLAKMARSGDNEKAGEAFVRLTELICGEEATKYMMEYYEDDYLSLMLDIMPFYVERVFPAVQQARRNALEWAKKAKIG